MFSRRALWLWPLLLGACHRGRPGPAAVVRLEITGGPNPGVYQASSNAPACLREVTGAGSWGVQLTDWRGPKAGLRSLQLVVPSTTQPGRFYLGLVFGDFFTGVVHEIETRPAALRQRGHGQVSILPRRDGATVSVSGMTMDSVAITATITCATAQDHRGGIR
jgi:hypothetical protein